MQQRIQQLPWGLIWTATVIAAMAAVVASWGGGSADRAAAESEGPSAEMSRECLLPPPPGADGVAFMIPAPEARRATEAEGDVVRAAPAPPAGMAVPEECESVRGHIRVSPADQDRLGADGRVVADCARQHGVELPPPPPGFGGHPDTERGGR